MPPLPAPADLPPLIAILGPTASGKSHLALLLAREFGLEIVNCDSRQIYREMEIGTAKPTPAERKAVPHHLLDLASPAETFSAGAYAQVARACLEDLWANGKRPLLVGGTGFYFEALVHGLPELPTDASTRERLQERFEAEGLPTLVDEFRRLDPEGAQTVDCANPRRVLRALEILQVTGLPLRQARQGQAHLPARTLVFLVRCSRQSLEERILRRTQEMLDAGLEGEVRKLFAAYGPEAPGLRSIGYAEWKNREDGAVDRAEIREAICLHTRQYAKRQETWFAKRPGGTFHDPADPQTLELLRRQTADFGGVVTV